MITAAGRGTTVDDTVLAADVLAQMSVDPTMETRGIAVRVKDGVVHLTGRVDDLLASERAALSAASVRGVLGVRSEIGVLDSGSPDLEIHRDVQSTLSLHPRAELFEGVAVEVRKGVVALAGVIPSLSARAAALAAVKGVASVRAVEDRTEVYAATGRGDEELESKVRRALAADALMSGSQITSAVRDGRVVMTGTLLSEAQRTRARMSASVGGVVAIDAAEPVVLWPPAEAPRALPAEAELAVQRSFRDEADVHAYGLQATIRHGVATLTGRVGNARARLYAERLARYTVGIRRIDNQITVDRLGISDAAIEDRARAALALHPHVRDYPIDVAVSEGIVRLSGSVSSHFESAETEDVVLGLSGVAGADNGLVVTRPEPGYAYDVNLEPYAPIVEGWVKLSKEPVRGDGEIRNSIERHLARRPELAGDSVSVRVHRGRTTLAGSVANVVARDAAIRSAVWGGATGVEDRLTVRHVPVL